MTLEKLLVDANEILEDIEKIDIGELQEELKSGKRESKLSLCNLLNSIYTIKKLEEAINRIKNSSEQDYINSNLKSYPNKPNVIKLSNLASSVIMLCDKFNRSRVTKLISYIVSPVVFIFLGGFGVLVLALISAELDPAFYAVVFGIIAMIGFVPLILNGFGSDLKSTKDKNDKELSNYKIEYEKVEQENNDLRVMLKKQYQSIHESISFFEPKLDKFYRFIEELDIISPTYYAEANIISELIQSGRADTVKEAINLNEDSKQKAAFYKEQLAYQQRQAEAEEARARAAEQQAYAAQQAAAAQQIAAKAAQNNANRTVCIGCKHQGHCLSKPQSNGNCYNFTPR